MKSRSLFSLCLALVCGAAYPTDLPAQVLSILGSGPQGLYDQVGGIFRMANNGSGSYTGHLMVSLFDGILDDTNPRGGYWNGSGFTDLVRFTTPYETQFAAATCGTYAGIFGGWQDGKNVTGYVPPCYWTGTTSADQVIWQVDRSGTFWDVNYSPDTSTNWFVGYYYNSSGVKLPARWHSGYGANSPEFFSTTGYDGGEAWCINKDRDVGGQLITTGSGNSSPPVIWKFNGTNWDTINIASSQDWVSGRGGYIIGITDRQTGDSNGPYAVGWMYPDQHSIGAEPFIYSVGTGRIKFVGTDYGVPTQMSNAAYTNDDKVISFSGASSSGGRPYVWIGSPNRDDTFSGVADDLYAFLDPDQNGWGFSSVGASITGMNKAYVLGGGGFPYSDSDPSPVNVAWITSTSTNWTRVSGTETLTKGTLATGSTMNGLNDIDGLFTRINSVPSITQPDPNIIVQVDANIGMGRNAIAFRATTRLASAGVTVEYKIDLWNWSTSSWDNKKTISSMPRYWRSDLVKLTSGLSNYIDGSGDARARMTVRQTYIPPGTLGWPADFEQAVFMYK